MTALDLAALQDLLLKAAVLTPIVWGLVQVIKQAGIPGRWVPLLALVVGSAIGWFFVNPGAWGILTGLALGLSATGLYEFGKTTVAGRGQE